VPVDADEAEHIYVQVVLGTPKDQAPFRLTPDGEAFWDQLAADVARMRSTNPDADFEAPSMEVPDLPPWVEQAPEAQPAPPAPATPPPAPAEGSELARTWVRARGEGDGVSSATDTGRPPPPPDDDGE
jgi:hypothetical protein